MLHEDDSYTTHQVDHIISRKHGGKSEPDNLAYACLRCNAWKGSDVGTFDPRTRQFVPLFNPRLLVHELKAHYQWEDHFLLRGAVIEPLTAEGDATAKLLKLNLDKRVVERRILISVGRFPRSS